MRSVGWLNLLVLWLLVFALPSILLFFLWRSYRLLSRICDHAAAIRAALERDALP